MTIDDFPIPDWITEQDIILLAIVFAALLILLLNARKIRHNWLEWRTRRCLNRIGIQQRRNVVCSDGMDGEYVLDRLIMLPTSILLISFKPFSGNIFCAERISEWTQVIAQKSYKFENPLFELENQLTALRLEIPGVPIRGLLFFDHNAAFPKGHPDSVIHPGNIPTEYLRQNCAEADAGIVEAWRILLKLPVGNSSDRQLRLKT